MVIAKQAPESASSSPSPVPGQPDFESIKRRQQATWSSGNYACVASRIVFSAELLCESADLQAGWRVLDVATGSGNVAIAAARRGCRVVGADYVPSLLETARTRAQAENLDINFVEADAEDLPFPTGTFDAVTSVYGAMFAPNHSRTAAEMARVCRPGGIIALASWTPDGFIGEMFRLFGKYMPPAPGLVPPVRWGDERHLRTLFGDAVGSMRSQVRTLVMRYPSAEENVEFFRKYYGPTLKTFAALSPEAGDDLAREMAELNRKYDRNGGAGGPVAIASDYLESVIVRA